MDLDIEERSEQAKTPKCLAANLKLLGRQEQSP